MSTMLKPEIEVVRFKERDVIATSGVGGPLYVRYPSGATNYHLNLYITSAAEAKQAQPDGTFENYEWYRVDYDSGLVNDDNSSPTGWSTDGATHDIYASSSIYVWYEDGWNQWFTDETSWGGYYLSGGNFPAL